MTLRIQKSYPYHNHNYDLNNEKNTRIIRYANARDAHVESSRFIVKIIKAPCN